MKNKSIKVDCFCEKKIKYCVIDLLFEVELSNEVFFENDSKGVNKMDDGFCSFLEKNVFFDK